MNACICGLGAYLPAEIIRNADLAARLDTSDEWIASRTGIRARHQAAASEATSDLAFRASVEALEQARISASEIDLILVATATPDTLVPATACRLQGLLGARDAAGMDVSGACSGFLYALHLGAGLIRAGMHRRILVVGAETLTRFLNWKDRASAVLFGDGAGAAVLGCDGPLRLLHSRIGADGVQGDLIQIPIGSRHELTEELLRAHGHCVKLKGQEVFRLASRKMADEVVAAMAALGLSPADADWVIPHQANRRIIEAVGEQLGIDPARVVLDLEETGNTSAASVPIALSRLAKADRLKRGQTVVLVTFGGGITWACQVWKVEADM